MTDTPNLLIDRNLEAATIISLRREAGCFAFLSANAVSAPLPIDSLNLDLASVDYFGGRASLWATLEIRSSATNDEPTAASAVSMVSAKEVIAMPLKTPATIASSR